MAFPSVVATNTTNGSTAATNKVCNLPAGISSGDLLILIIRSGASDTHSTPTGWTDLVLNNTTDASDDSTSIFWKQADGTEGSTVTVNGTNNQKFSSLSWRITGHESNRSPGNSAVATGTSTLPDPNALTPAGGAKDYLWLWVGAWEGEQTSPPTGNPTNFTSDIIGADSGTAGNIATNTRCASASRQLNASTLNPTGWTISTSDDWSAWVLVVHPNTSTPQALSGSIGATSGFSGVLNNAKSVISIVQANSSTLNGNTTIGRALDVDVSAQTTLSGNTIVQKDVLSVLSAYSDWDGELSIESPQAGYRSLLALWLGGGAFTAAGEISLSGSLSAQATLGAEVANLRGSQSQDNTTSTVNGSLSTTKGLVGDLHGRSSLSGTLNMLRNIESGPTKQLCYNIQSSGDDVGVDGGTFTADGEIIPIGRHTFGTLEQQGAFRFTGMSELIGKTIHQSNIIFTSATTVTGTSNIHTHFEDAANPTQITDSSDFEVRTFSTSPSIDWDLGDSSTGQKVSTPDLSEALTVVVNRSGFVGTANYFLHYHEATGTGRQFRSYDYSQEDSATLCATITNDNLGGTSFLSGVLNTVKSIVAAVNPVSALSGAMSAVKSFFTTVQGNTVASSDANINRQLDVDLSARSTVGNLHLLSNRQLYSTLDVDSYLQGQLNANKLLISRIIGQGALSGNLIIQSDDNIEAALNSTSRMGLDVLLLQRQLGGTIGTPNDWDASLNTNRLLISDFGGVSMLRGVLSNNKSIGGNVLGQSTIGANVTRIFGVNGEIATNNLISGNVNLVKNFVGGTQSVSRFGNSGVIYLVGFDSAIDGASQFGNGNLTLTTGLGGNLGTSSDLSLGILVDRQLLSQLRAAGLLSGILSVQTLDLSGLEIVRFTLHLNKSKELSLRHTNTIEFDLVNGRSKEITLER